MSYTSILVHIDANSPLGGRSRIAADIADTFRAMLIGVAGWAPMSVFLAEEALSGRTLSVPELQDIKRILELKGREFRAAFDSSERRVEWRSVLDFPAEAVAREARAADLVVIGNAKENKDPFRALDPGTTILNAGRPVLVVPQGLVSFSARRIAVAWKDVREARRAVYDALPFLKRAESVVIVEVLEVGKSNGASLGLKDVVTYLTRHKVEIVTEQVRPADVTPINSLLRVVENENINLLVAGAYGRSRLGEWVFGGVTRDLLAQSPICCLFSH